MGNSTVPPAGAPPNLSLEPMREPLSSLSVTFAYLVDICTIPDLVRPGHTQLPVDLTLCTARANHDFRALGSITDAQFR